MKTASKETQLRKQVKALKEELEKERKTAIREKVDRMHSQMLSHVENAVEELNKAKDIANEYGFYFEFEPEEDKTVSYSNLGGWNYPRNPWDS